MARRVLSTLLTLLCLAVPAVAGAQTVTLSSLTPVEWVGTERNNRPIDQINYQDCLDDATIRITFTVANATSGLTLQAWAGGSMGCNDEQRANNDDCTEINGNVSVNQTVIELTVRELLSSVAEGTTPDQGAEFCASLTPPGPVNFYLMFVSGASQQGQPATATFHFDMEGPPAPTDLSLGVGEERLFPEWEAPAEKLGGYRIYCEAVAAGEGEDCTASALVSGERPDPMLECGSVSNGNATSGVADDLANGQRYAVAVSAYDEYENSGPLSELVCGTPEPVTGYFEAYRNAGGKAGGGFCAFGRQAPRASDALYALLLGALLFRRRAARSRA